MAERRKGRRPRRREQRNDALPFKLTGWGMGGDGDKEQRGKEVGTYQTSVDELQFHSIECSF